jgi:hypothetical protein
MIDMDADLDPIARLEHMPAVQFGGDFPVAQKQDASAAATRVGGQSDLCLEDVHILCRAVVHDPNILGPDHHIEPIAKP